MKDSTKTIKEENMRLKYAKFANSVRIDGQEKSFIDNTKHDIMLDDKHIVTIITKRTSAQVETSLFNAIYFDRETSEKKGSRKSD